MNHIDEAERLRRFPGLLGMRAVELRHGFGRFTMDVEERHLRLRANGLHAGAVVSLADSVCGAACQASLPDDKTFTTVELKANLISTTSSGTLVAEATPVHMGGRTHVWEARVTRDDGKLIAVFVCTQLIIDRT
jgi:1,4-dihydroxy-2-naphthoyl-CoA hydrolase